MSSMGSSMHWICLHARGRGRKQVLFEKGVHSELPGLLAWQHATFQQRSSSLAVFCIAPAATAGAWLITICVCGRVCEMLSEVFA
jgi:hypothetical protein